MTSQHPRRCRRLQHTNHSVEGVQMFRTLGPGKNRIIMLLAVIAFLVLEFTAQAQITGPCADTITKYCSDVIPGEGRIMKCLNDHRDAQSIACKDWIAEQQ